MHQHNIYISDVVLRADGHFSAQMITCCVCITVCVFSLPNTIGNSVDWHGMFLAQLAKLLV